MLGVGAECLVYELLTGSCCLPPDPASRGKDCTGLQANPGKDHNFKIVSQFLLNVYHLFLTMAKVEKSKIEPSQVRNSLYMVHPYSVLSENF